MEFPFFLVLMIAVAVIRFFWQKEMDKKDAVEDYQKQRKEFTEVVEAQKDRENVRIFDEERFWEIIEGVGERSGTHYRNFLGLFKDRISSLSSDELIEMDNLLLKFYRGNLTQELYAAGAIVFKSEDPGSAYLLMNIFIIHGRVFFKQACKSPELMIGKEFSEVDGRLFNNVIAEVYYGKTKELMPIPAEEEWDFPGEKWQFRDLPSRFPELWGAFG